MGLLYLLHLFVCRALRSEMRLLLKTKDSVQKYNNCGGRIIQNNDWVTMWTTGSGCSILGLGYNFFLLLSFQPPSRNFMALTGFSLFILLA